MAKLTAAQRKKLPISAFGIKPTASQPAKYPMEDKPHAANAKSRATQMVNKGKLSASAAAKIRAKANKILGKRAV